MQTNRLQQYYANIGLDTRKNSDLTEEAIYLALQRLIRSDEGEIKIREGYNYNNLPPYAEFCLSLKEKKSEIQNKKSTDARFHLFSIKFDIETNKVADISYLDPFGEEIINLPILNRDLSLQSLSKIIATYLNLLESAKIRKEHKRRELEPDPTKIESTYLKDTSDARNYFISIQFILDAKATLRNSIFDQQGKGFFGFGKKTPDIIVKLRNLFKSVTIATTPEEILQISEDALKILTNRVKSKSPNLKVEALCKKTEGGLLRAALGDATMNINTVFELSQNPTSHFGLLPNEILDHTSNFIRGKRK